MLAVAALSTGTAAFFLRLAAVIVAAAAGYAATRFFLRTVTRRQAVMLARDFTAALGAGLTAMMCLPFVTQYVPVLGAVASAVVLWAEGCLFAPPLLLAT